MELHIWLNCCTFTIPIYSITITFYSITITIYSITIPNTISITCVNIISLFKQWKLWQLCVPLHLWWQNP